MCIFTRCRIGRSIFLGCEQIALVGFIDLRSLYLNQVAPEV